MSTVKVPKFRDTNSILNFNNFLKSNTNIELDFSELGFAVPSGMVFLSRIINKAKLEGRITDFKNTQANSYEANMNFYDSFDFNVDHHNAPGNENYIPLQSLNLAKWRKEAEKQYIPVGQLIGEKVGHFAFLIARSSRGQFYEAIKYILREMIRNAAEHSKADRLWVAGQYWPKMENSVELAIYDGGVGIQKAIAQNPKFRNISTAKSALQAALLPATSGVKVYNLPEEITKDDGQGDYSNSGFGLYIARRLALKYGKMEIGSGDTRISISEGGRQIDRFGLDGTYIVLNFKVDRISQFSTTTEKLAKEGEGFAQRHLFQNVIIQASKASRGLF